jgi:hypothetical protein
MSCNSLWSQPGKHDCGDTVTFPSGPCAVEPSRCGTGCSAALEEVVVDDAARRPSRCSASARRRAFGRQSRWACHDRARTRVVVAIPQYRGSRRDRPSPSPIDVTGGEVGMRCGPGRGSDRLRTLGWASQACRPSVGPDVGLADIRCRTRCAIRAGPSAGSPPVGGNRHRIFGVTAAGPSP